MNSKDKMAKFAEIAKKNIDNNSMSIVISIKDGGKTYDTDTVIIIDESLEMGAKLAIGIAAQKAMIAAVLNPIIESGGNTNDILSHLVALAKPLLTKTKNADANTNTTIH